MSLKEEINEENVKLLVESVVDILNNSEIQLFQNKPTVDIFMKGGDSIGMSLIDDGKTNFEYNLCSKPRKGEIYLFADKSLLLDAKLIKILADDQAKRIIDEIQEGTAYSLNIERVIKLIKNKHYSVAVVFLVSAFENAMRDIFFQNNVFWFYRSQSEVYNIEDYYVKKYGIKIKELKIKTSFRLGYDKDIDGEKWILTKTDYNKCLKWKRIEYWNKIYSTCKKIGIYDDYIKKLIANNNREIGQFDILKDLLLDPANRSKFNFQRILRKNGVCWAYKNFYYIDLEKNYKTDLNDLENYFQKRHAIIHGKLEDTEIKKEDIKDMMDIINRILSFLKDKINQFKLNPNVILQYGTFDKTKDYI